MTSAATSIAVRQPLFTPHMLATALAGDAARPLIQMADGETLTLGEVRDLTSQYVQALSSFGVRQGSRLALLSANRFEVIVVNNAVSMIGACLVPLHPMGSRDDYLYVVEDAAIEVLIYDPAKYGDKAVELAGSAKVGFLTFGTGAIGDDLAARAAGFSPMPLIPPAMSGSEIMRLSYSGGTTGNQKRLPAIITRRWRRSPPCWPNGSGRHRRAR